MFSQTTNRFMDEVLPRVVGKLEAKEREHERRMLFEAIPRRVSSRVKHKVRSFPWLWHVCVCLRVCMCVRRWVGVGVLTVDWFAHRSLHARFFVAGPNPCTQFCVHVLIVTFVRLQLGYFAHIARLLGGDHFTI